MKNWTFKSFASLACMLLFGAGNANSMDHAFPKIGNSSIIFLNKKSLSYQKEKQLFASPQIAESKRVPFKVLENPEIIKEWNRLLIVKNELYYEDAETSVKVFDFNGQLIGETKKIFGEIKIIFLRKSDRILFCQRSQHFQLSNGYIFSSNGKLLNELTQPDNTIDCDKSNDDKVMWFIANAAKSFDPYLEVIVVDYKGKVIKKFDEVRTEKIEIKYEGKIYEIKLPVPEMPG